MEFSRQEKWSGLPFSSSEELPNPGIEPWSPASKADSLLFELQGSLVQAHSSTLQMLLLLSRFSRVRLCATPQMAAHQAPPFLEWVAIEEASRQPGCGHFTGQWTQFLQ